MTSKYYMAPQYTRDHLDECDVYADPFAQFKQWFGQAREHAPDAWPEPQSMTLATADTDGQVSARIVLLKELDDSGFVFYTNYESYKARQINENPQAALLFYWPYMERQIRAEGRIEKVSRNESEAYFRTRPRGSQISAWASRQSEVVQSREILEQQFAVVEKRFTDGDIPLPDFWGGYRLKPENIEFWQGRNNRLHDRLRYEFVDGIWSISRLSP